jgi:hypothetical protein
MSTPDIRKLLDHGGICTQVDYTYWMIFSKRCPHQTLENYLISWWDLYSGRLYILDDILQEMSTPDIRKLLDIMVGFVLK